jgi:hypothetical protein
MICERELSNIKGAYRGRLSNDTKVDHCLRATEAILKAIIWKKQKWASYPKKGDKGHKYLYTHNLDAMLDQTNLRDRLRASQDLWTSWQVVTNAVLKQSKYSASTVSDNEANEVARSTRYPDTGVVPWLIARYREMT